MFFDEKLECSFKQKIRINYNRMAQTMNQFSSTAVTLSANPLVEKCLAKLANEVTEQVRDKIIDILIAVLTRECEDFDGESVRRLLVAELETTPLTFAVEKRASGTTKTTKTLKEKEPKEKKVRSPKEPKEKAPKAVLSEEEREARKAAKQAEKEAKKEAAKAAKQAEKEAEKEARKAAKKAEREAAKEANKDADKEAAKAAKKAEKEAEKAAKLAEREAAKAARKAEKDAEREAAKAAKLAEKEAAAAAAPAVVKEQRLPIPWCGTRIEGRCEALRVYHGLFAQCTADATEISAFCPSCEKSGAKFGTCAMRAACDVFDYTDPSGKKCVKLANIVDKFGVEGGLEAFVAEAAKHSITIPAEHLNKEVKQRGRPKSNSPRASKVATSDTGSGSETETDDEAHQQKRKQVSKTASAEAPKKRGRPAKNPKSDVTPSDEVIQDLVASAAAMSVASTPSTPAAVTPKTSPVVVETPAAPKKAKAMTLKKPAQRKTRVIEEQTFWVDTFNGAEILIRQEDNATFEASTGEPLGFWDEATKTIIECDDEDEE
jgi:hypothetical protein